MKQDVVANANALTCSINVTGRVAAWYGNFFDTKKAERKPESEPALAETRQMVTV